MPVLLLPVRIFTMIQDKSDPVYNSDGEIIAWNYSGSRSADGSNTDTILYVQMIGHDVTVIAVPRDLYVPGLEDSD